MILWIYIRRGAYRFDISRLIGDINVSSDLVFKEVLISILSELHYITNLLVTEENDVHAFGFKSIMAKTLNSVFNDRGPEIRDRVKELKFG